MDNLLESGLFNDIDPTFMAKVKKTLDTMSGKSDIEIIGTFMSLSNEATQRGVVLDSEQQKALILFLREKLPPEKRQNFDLITSMMGG